MRYQCASCDREGKTIEELSHCIELRHEIIDYPDENDIRDNNSKKQKNSKVKGFINDELYVESVIIDGKPKFLVKGLLSNTITIKERMETEDTTYRPLEKNECGYFPYNFTSDEIQELTEKPIETEKILDEIKEQIDKYIVAREIDKHLILGNILLTYSQEWIHTIHFLFLVGETESGKSTVLHLGRWLNYRCLYGEDIPHADIYNFLGTEEEGNGTICEDEAQDIARDRQKLRTYKNSYSKGSVKARIIGVDSLGKKQVFYKTFCPKWFAGEKVPEDKGFKERLAIVFMTEGSPDSNIKRPTREEMQKLNKIRNKLLIWKLQKMGNIVNRADSKLEKRDQELWEDFLTMVDGTKFYEKCESVVNYYIQQRHEAIKNSFEARIFKLLIDKIKSNLELSFLEYWNYLTIDNQEFTGHLDVRKTNTFYPDDFGRYVTHNSLSSVLEQKFQAEKRIKVLRENDSQRRVTYYSFKQDVLQTLAKKYGVKLTLDMFSSGQSGQPTQQDDHVNHVDDLKQETKS